MTFKNKSVQKFVSCLLIIAVLAPAGFVLLSRPQKTEAIWGVGDVNLQALDFQEIFWKVLQEVLMYIARKLLDKMTQATINWINDGFRGKPLFIENPGSFFKDVVKNEIKGFVDLSGYSAGKFPFGKDFALNVINQAKNTFENNARYSLSKTIADPVELENRKNNFQAGGWNDLLLNTQELQNNFLGYGILANDDLARKLGGTSSPVTKVKETVQQGLGFLSPQVCKSNPTWSPEKLSEGFVKPPYNPTPGMQISIYDQIWNKQVETARLAFEAKYGCKEGAAATTPGSLIGDKVGQAMKSKGVQAELAASMGNSIAAIFDALINQFFQKGLTGINNLISPPPPKPLDEWNYYDNGVPVVTPNLDGGGGPLVSTNPQMIVSVNVINNNGGVLQSNEVNLFVDGNPVINGELALYPSGAHTISATNQAGYTTTIGGDCAADGSITLGNANGSPKNCVVTFEDIMSGGPTGKLTVTKIVINDNGGTQVASSVPLYVDGNLKTSGIEYTYDVGAHTVAEANQAGYLATITGDCAADGSVTLAAGDIKSCTITNDDILGGGTLGKLTLIKIVINDNGGTLQANNVQLFVDGNLRLTGVPYLYNMGPHIVTEDNTPGYTGTIGGACAADGSVTLLANDDKICTITNTDN